MVEEVVEVLAKRVTDKYNVVSQSNFVLREVFADLVLDNALTKLDVLETLLDLLLQRCLEVELID